MGPGGRGSYLESRENQQENDKESVQHDTCGGKVNQRTTPILPKLGRKGDSGDRPSVALRIKARVHDRSGPDSVRILWEGEPYLRVIAGP